MEILTSPAPPKPCLFLPQSLSLSCLLSQDGSHGLRFNLWVFSMAAHMVEILIFVSPPHPQAGGEVVCYACLPLCTHKIYVCIFR